MPPHHTFPVQSNGKKARKEEWCEKERGDEVNYRPHAVDGGANRCHGVT